jgi:hypothetical protein
MTCNQCGQPAEGALCRPCERAQRAADEYESVTDGGEAAVEEPNGIELSAGEFYHLHVGGTERVFAAQADAIEHLRDNAADLDLDDPDVRLAKVSTGDEWEIEPVAWQNIALQLLQ